ncbi:MAG: transcription termination/antitermination protein NusG [Pseudobutyrivibrio sp.]|nr:transcription termination/antitermination protein NusG [Pseudobutyrivibrio sp.]
MAEAKWYVVHTYSGYENKVMTNILKSIETQKLEEQILDVRVPMVDVSETKDGVRKTVSKKMYPGYVLINMIMNDETWYVVRNTRGVTGFVGPGSKPVPLSEAEVNAYLLGSGTEKVNVEVDFEVGDTLSVINGTWKDTVGVVKSINTKKQTVTISVEMFGRETPVEIDFTDVRKMN